MNSDLINKIILIKEVLDPKYIVRCEDSLRYDDRKAYNLINDKEKLKELLNVYENSCGLKEIFKYLDSPEVRYLYCSSFHDAKIYNVEYTSKALYIYLNGSQATSWPKDMNSKIILVFYGAKNVEVDKLPSFFDSCEIQALNKRLFINISSTCKSCSFSFKDVKFVNVE